LGPSVVAGLKTPLPKDVHGEPLAKREAFAAAGSALFDGKSPNENARFMIDAIRR
jgi:hypothetical protein